MDLFIQPELTFEKVSAEVTLPEDPNVWPNEIMQELFKQVPYISDFEPHVIMDRVDAERGFGFGHVEVMNKTEIQQGASPEGLEAAGIKQARIPIIIKDRKLMPFDVLVTEDSSMLPLTENRLRQAIFRPSNFDITARTPGDMSMIGQLYPPYRQNYGFGGGGATMSVGMGKEGAHKKTHKPIRIGGDFLGTQLGGAAGGVGGGAAAHALGAKKLRYVIPSVFAGSLLGGELGRRGTRRLEKHLAERAKHGSVLQAILPTIDERDYGRFFDELGDQGLQAAFMKNGAATAGALQTLAAFEPASDEKTSAAVLGEMKPTVVQLVREPEGYIFKTANHRAWHVERTAWDRATALKTLGEKVVLAADVSGSASAALGEGVTPEVPEEGQPSPIEDFGVYQVTTEEGETLTGHVFPNLLDIDGTPLPLALFWNGEHAAVQGAIVGTKVGDDIPMVEGHPRGHGAFYDLNGEEPVATIPLTIHATLSGGEGGVTFQAETFDGREVGILIQPNIASVMPGEAGTMLVPDTMQWLPLDECDDVSLVGDGETVEKVSHPTRPFASVEIRSGGVECFSIDGLPIDKLAHEDKHFLSTDDALFLLSGLGVQPAHASQKLAEAMTGERPVRVKIGRAIRTAREALNEAVKTSSDRAAMMPDLKVSLIKEAAVIPDPTAVDTVLSLGFINPENTETFLAYLPHIEEAQKKMCELLIASRLGLQEVPSSALEKAVRATEQVLEGLKVIAFQQN